MSTLVHVTAHAWKHCHQRNASVCPVTRVQTACRLWAVKPVLVKMMARVSVTQHNAIVAHVKLGTQGRSATSLLASVPARHANTVAPASQAGKTASLAHAQRESRDSRVSRTPDPVRLTRVRTTPTVRISAAITSVTALLGYPERTARKATTATANHAKTAVHAKRKMTVTRFASVSRVTRVTIVLKTWMSVLALLAKTVVSV